MLSVVRGGEGWIVTFDAPDFTGGTVSIRSNQPTGIVLKGHSWNVELIGWHSDGTPDVIFHLTDPN
jgi:hypothetical protein